MSTVVKVSEEYTHRSQSWCFQGIYRNHSGMYEVGVRKNAYPDQSHANISVWGANGWHHFCSLPVESWFNATPNYTKKALDNNDKDAFLEIRDLLLAKLALGLWGDSKVNITGEGA
jgi:hypothetical protein